MTQQEIEAKLDAISRERIALQKAAYATCLKPATAALLEQAAAKQAEWDDLYRSWIPPHNRTA